MNKQANIKSVETRNERTHYSGVFQDFQTFGDTINGKPYSQQEIMPYSEYQNFLYKRAMFGLKMYTPEEIKAMHWQKRKRIQKVQKRTQIELNKWKQNRVIALTNKIFSKLVRSPLAQGIIDVYSEPDSDFVCDISFKDLNITKEAIIEKLLSENLLPHNFKTIK